MIIPNIWNKKNVPNHQPVVNLAKNPGSQVMIGNIPNFEPQKSGRSHLHPWADQRHPARLPHQRNGSEGEPRLSFKGLLGVIGPEPTWIKPTVTEHGKKRTGVGKNLEDP